MQMEHLVCTTFAEKLEVNDLCSLMRLLLIRGKWEDRVRVCTTLQLNGRSELMGLMPLGTRLSGITKVIIPNLPTKWKI